MSKELDRFPLLAPLGDDERSVVGDHLALRQLAAGARLFGEGDRADGAWLLSEGRVLLSSERSGVREELGPGATLGALSIVAAGRREATAEAVSPSRLLVLSRASYRALAEAHPEVACRLLETLLVETAQLLRAELGAPPGVDRSAAND